MTGMCPAVNSHIRALHAQNRKLDAILAQSGKLVAVPELVRKQITNCRSYQLGLVENDPRFSCLESALGPLRDLRQTLIRRVLIWLSRCWFWDGWPSEVFLECYVD